MSFFAGRYSDGKTVLSLNKAAGGDVNVHKTPNANTIFHSDMPFVLVESSYEANLAHASNGYYVCQMPAAIANLKANDPGRVILTAVEINGTHRGFINGTQSQVGQYLTFAEDPPARAFAAVGLTAGFGCGVALATGTYSYNSSMGHEESIARRGTGGTTVQSTDFGIYRPGGGATAGQAIATAYNQLGFPTNTNKVLLDANNASYWNPNSFAPIGSAGRGHDWFYVRNSNIRGYIGKKKEIPANVNVIYQNGFLYSCRGSTTNMAGQSVNVKYVQDAYNVTPTKVIWYVLNLKYANGGMSVTTNPFTGSSILISPSNFTIKGVSLPNTGWRFINQNAFGNLAYRPDMEYIGNNASYSGVFGDTTARCEFVASNKGALYSPVNYGGSYSQISIYKFSAGKTWYVNSSNNTIGNEHGVVWGPNSVPLRLLPGNVASAYVGDDINPTYPGTGNYYRALSTINLGLPNANATVILTTEMITGNLNTACSPARSYNGQAFQVQGRKAQSYTEKDSTFHQILTLPPNRLVPYHTTAAYTYSQRYASSNEMEFIRNGYTYTIKNLGNGNAELGVIVHSSQNAAIFLPRLRVTVQRLT